MIIFAVMAIIIAIGKLLLSFALMGNLGDHLLNQMDRKITQGNEVNYLVYFFGIDGIIELFLGIFILIFI